MTDEEMSIQSTDEIADEKIATKYADKIAEEYRDIKSDCSGYSIIIDAVLYGLKVNKSKFEKENAILKKALNLYINWADECGVAWDNFPNMTEKWYKIVEEKDLGWIEGLTFMAIEEAKEQLEVSK